jgi:allantoinase
MLDLIIRKATLVSSEAIQVSDIAIEAGQIVEIIESITHGAKEEINATGLHVFPGLIDAHVHFNEPGRKEWEGIQTGSSAFAAGGGTLYVDMPLNSDPPLLTAKEFQVKKEIAQHTSVTDFAFWGGLTPDNLEHLPELAEVGVIGFKAFMSNSGIAEYRAVDEVSLYKGMQIAAKLNVPVAVHAESEALTSELTQQLRQQGRKAIRDYLESRPVIAELEAINRAILFAEETNCDLHIVHVSSAKGVELVTRAKALGVSVTCETCPHYLCFTEDDLEALGAVAKCAPPLRNNEERRALWQKVLQGEIDLIASDHSPSSPDLKINDDFFAVWGGISGVQSTLQVLLSNPDLALTDIARLTAVNPAQRFKLDKKGRLEAGYDADLVLVDLAKQQTLGKEDLFYRHKQSPYVGRTFKGIIKQTLLRGQTVYADGRMIGKPDGRFIRKLKW